MMPSLSIVPVLVVILGYIHGQSDDNYTLVTTTYGTLRGRVDYTTQIPVKKFYGIPYAKPPVASLRFKAPVEPEKWTAVRDALLPGNICMQDIYPQYADLYTNVTIDEDCLFLNVYVPQVNATSLPVMVWIHGGGYIIGFGSFYDGSILAQKEVIVVTINYRLGVFGFMSTDEDSMPGNYGMMDQIEALKWVQNNIAAFGGDPKQVTIFGESAGAGSVSLLTISPLTKGLFKRVIVESGSCLSPWATISAGFRVSSRVASRLIASDVGCRDHDDSSKVMLCLQAVDGENLLNTTSVISRTLDTVTTMAPRVEKTFNFLPDDPAEMLTRGEFNHVDTLRGFNIDESGIFFVPLIRNGTSQQDNANIMYGYWLKSLNDLDQDYMTSIMKGRQLTNVPSTPLIIRHAIENNDDLAFITPTLTEINLISQRSKEHNHYLYEFNHRPSYSPYPEWINATHGQELPFLFGLQANATSNDFKVSSQMVEMWTNFAKSGDPSMALGPAWKPYRPDSRNYLFIDPVSELKLWSRNEVFAFGLDILRVYNGYVAPSAGNVVG